MIKGLKEKNNAEVITVTVDVGQPENLTEVEEKAKNLGVSKHYSIDAKDEFATDYVFPAIKANALYEGKYPISTSLSRPLIVKKMVEIAENEGATGLAHGCTGKGNDQVRFDISIGSLAPDLKIIAPVREWSMTRAEEIENAKTKGIPVSTAAKKKNLAPLTLIETLNKAAGKHGVGRIDHIEDRLVGIKSREVYECPAATVLLEAHKDLEKLVLRRHEVLFKQQIDAQWTFLAYAGLWMDPLREDLEAFINKSQENVHGEVRVKLYRGGLQVVGRSSPMSLYDQNLVNYNIKTGFNQAYSKGFIELWGLQTRMYNVLKRKAKEQKTAKGGAKDKNIW